MKKIIIVKDRNNQEIDLEVAMAEMDKLILFEAYQRYKDQSPQIFYDHYCRMHKEQYRQDFDV